MGRISGLSQKSLDFSKIMSGILDPRIPTFWNSNMERQRLAFNDNSHRAAVKSGMKYLLFK